MIEKYEKYLDILGSYLKKYFEQQKPYIHCKEGCSICCETGLYPLTKVESDYLMVGFKALSEIEKQQIYENIKKIKNYRKTIKEGQGYYQCPMLINNRCSIYNYRGIICRSYGLMQFYFDENNIQKYRIPCCASNELNYSEVYDENTETISMEMYTASGIKEEPLSYNLSLKYLLNNEITKNLGIDFGETKSLVDWF